MLKGNIFAEPYITGKRYDGPANPHDEADQRLAREVNAWLAQFPGAEFRSMAEGFSFRPEANECLIVVDINLKVPDQPVEPDGYLVYHTISEIYELSRFPDQPSPHLGATRRLAAKKQAVLDQYPDADFKSHVIEPEGSRSRGIQRVSFVLWVPHSSNQAA